PTIDTMFTFTKPLPSTRSWLGDIKQAGGRQILIDQNGRTLFYGIHANQAFDGPGGTPKIHEDRDNPREITVRLLALHVVFTLPGHPEFVWATFEHSDGVPDNRATDLHRDVAPIHPGTGNPTID